MSMKKENDTVGNWTRDLTACSAVPQPTVILRASTNHDEGSLKVGMCGCTWPFYCQHSGRSKASVCGRSLPGIVGWNPVGGMDVCVLGVLCVVQVEVCATGWSLVQRSPTDCGASLCVIWKPREWGGPDPRWGHSTTGKKHKLCSTDYLVRFLIRRTPGQLKFRKWLRFVPTLRSYIYIYITEFTVNNFRPLFGPSSDHTSFRFKENHTFLHLYERSMPNN
jgi:hypothetical protein